jgi:hypothetical protein
MENFYYEAINTMVCTQSDHETTTIKLKRLKAKINRFHHKEQRRLFINAGEQDRLDDESPTLYHFIRARKRHVSGVIQKIQDSNCMVHSTTAGILCILKEFI